MNEQNPAELQRMKEQAHVIEDPAKKEARAAAQIEAMRRVLDRLPKKVKRQLRAHENRGKSFTELAKKFQPALVLAILASALAACSKDNLVAPHLAPDYDCRPCPAGYYCPQECPQR